MCNYQVLILLYVLPVCLLVCLFVYHACNVTLLASCVGLLSKLRHASKLMFCLDSEKGVGSYDNARCSC